MGLAVLRRNLVTLPISDHGSSSQSSQPESAAIHNFAAARYLIRFSLSTRFGIGFAKSIG
jgi:hypothetical protein